jgi:acyl carrier protein
MDTRHPDTGVCREDLRSTVARWWGEMLECPETEITEESDFFDLGGTSLLALNLLDRVNTVFTLELEVLALLENSRFDTFVDLAARLVAKSHPQ